MKAIILCGGLGTRLGSITKDTPKPILDVAGKPFLEHVLNHISNLRLDEIVLSVGFHWEKVQFTIGDSWNNTKVSYSVEEKQLGTGGAIKKAMQLSSISEAIVMNGDTLLKSDYRELWDYGRKINADIALSLKRMEDCKRYGKVNLDSENKLIGFDEKGVAGEGLINAGVYYIKDTVFDNVPLETFSLEKNIMLAKLKYLNMYGLKTDSYFIDIGIPEDLERARVELI